MEGYGCKNVDSFIYGCLIGSQGCTPADGVTSEDPYGGSGYGTDGSVSHTGDLSQSRDASECMEYATAALQVPRCQGLSRLQSEEDLLPSEPLPCSSACAEYWLVGTTESGSPAERCEDDTFGGKSAFDAAAPGATAACTATAAAVLATAAPTLTVSGLQANRDANGLYTLRPVPMNGRPHYTMALYDGRACHLYWTPVGERSGLPEWQIQGPTYSSDDLPNPREYEEIAAAILSPSKTPPELAWTESTDYGNAVSSRLNFLPSRRDSNWCTGALAEIAHTLVATCCLPSDGATCGQRGSTPATCGVDCNALWAPLAQVCPQMTTFPDGSLSAFFASCDPKQLVAMKEQMAIVTEHVHGQEGDGHDFLFQADAGTRYEVTVRVPENSRVAASGIFILPPGASDTRQAQVSQTISTVDKVTGFTAMSTGQWTARARSFEGTGPVAVSVHAVGSAAEQAPLISADSDPHFVTVGCQMTRCHFIYDDSAIEGDGSGSSFDLRLDNVEAGRAYAVLVQLETLDDAAQISATFYQEHAEAGAAGFAAVVDAPLGSWSATPPGHQSFREHNGCTNEGRTCAALGQTFGIHPGRSYPTYAYGEFTAPAAGQWLLRVAMNCDVPFFADIEAEGCQADFFEDGGTGAYGCNANNQNGQCSAQVAVTITPGRYFDPSASTAASSAPIPLAVGPVVQVFTIVVERSVLQEYARQESL